jgi:uncharacterized protein (DUF1330 family)
MLGYIIVNIEVTDREGFERYRDAVPPMIAKHGGRYLVRGGKLQVKEGAPGWQRLVVLEFPSLAAAQAFYDDPDYAPLLALRLASTKSEMVMVEGPPPG